MEGNPKDAELLKQLDTTNTEAWKQLENISKTLSTMDQDIKWSTPKQDGKYLLFSFPQYSSKVHQAVQLLTVIEAVTPLYHWMKHGLPKSAELSPGDAIRAATFLIRSERFGEGEIAFALESGLFDAILTTLIQWYQKQL